MEEELSLRYIAGFFDGEGCISLTRRPEIRDGGQGWVCLRATVCNTRPLVIDEIHRRFGGSRAVSLPDKHRKQALYRVVMSDRQAERFLACILPYLVVKRAQAELALEIQRFKRAPGRYEAGRNGTGRRLRASVVEKENEYCERMRLLNFPPADAKSA